MVPIVAVLVVVEYPAVFVADEMELVTDAVPPVKALALAMFVTVTNPAFIALNDDVPGNEIPFEMMTDPTFRLFMLPEPPTLNK
jgi:hypothetical protein